MSINPFMKTWAERCIPVSKEGRSGCTKHREPSISVVMCIRPEIVPRNRLMTTGSPRSLRPKVKSPVNRQRKVVNLYIDSLIDENSVSDYLIVYTDRSVQRGVKSGCGYTATTRLWLCLPHKIFYVRGNQGRYSGVGQTSSHHTASLSH